VNSIYIYPHYAKQVSVQHVSKIFLSTSYGRNDRWEFYISTI